MTAINGRDLIAWGFQPGEWFKRAVATANAMRAEGADDAAILAHLRAIEPSANPVLLRTNALDFGVFLDAETEAERANAAAVIRHMDALMRVPTIVKGAVMPDACPSGFAEAQSPSAARSPAMTRSIRASTRPTSAARWRSRCFAGPTTRSACSTPCRR